MALLGQPNNSYWNCNQIISKCWRSKRNVAKINDAEKGYPVAQLCFWLWIPFHVDRSILQQNSCRYFFMTHSTIHYVFYCVKTKLSVRNRRFSPVCWSKSPLIATFSTSILLSIGKALVSIQNIMSKYSLLYSHFLVGDAKTTSWTSFCFQHTLWINAYVKNEDRKPNFPCQQYFRKRFHMNAKTNCIYR